KPKIVVDIEKGDVVTVVSGPWAGQTGRVNDVNLQKQTVNINVDVFGRDTPLELDFTQVKKKE
ncbi:MAG: KOW motif-containing protein, partial [bacterium]